MERGQWLLGWLLAVSWLILGSIGLYVGSHREDVVLVLLGALVVAGAVLNGVWQFLLAPMESASVVWYGSPTVVVTAMLSAWNAYHANWGWWITFGMLTVILFVVVMAAWDDTRLRKVPVSPPWTRWER